MKRFTTGFRILCIGILVLAFLQIAFTKDARSAEGHEVSVVSSGENIQSVAAELDARRTQLEQKEKDLAERDRRIAEREKELDSKILKLENLRAAVSGELEVQRKNNEERVIKMVNVLETMTPKSAAGVMESLDDGLAVDVLKRMDVKKVAKVMNIMDKARSARLSEQMTGYYKIASSKTEGRAVASVPETKENPKEKGGEKKNGEQSTRSR